MKRAAPIQISVKTPCGQNWQTMQPVNGGKFCESCQHVVTDFTRLTKSELYHWLQTNRTVACGRFTAAQLNTPLIPLPPVVPRWQSWYKVVAAGIALLTLKPAMARIGNEQPIELQPTKKKAVADTDSVIISGRVVFADGRPAAGAEVLFGNQPFLTDSSGKFSLEVKPGLQTQPTLLITTAPGMKREVRNYHPAMGNTHYDIVLVTPVISNTEIYMGGINFAHISIDPLTINLNKKQQLTTSCKSKLADLAMELRNNPTISINIKAFAPVQKEVSSAKQNALAIKKYLSDMEGIAEERLLILIEVVKGTKNVVDISAAAAE